MRAGVFLALAAALPLAVACQASGGQAKAAPDGKALFHEKCAMCHGKVGMGTGLLARRVQPAELLQRTDLTSDFVIQAARIGIGNMPPIPRGEASDAELKRIADYLATPPAKRK